MKVRNFYPVTFRIDGDDITLRLRRMNLEEQSDYTTKFNMLSEPTLYRFVSRASSGPEQDQDNKGAYVVPFEKIAAKRLEAMDIEKRAEFDAAMKQDVIAIQDFIYESFEKYVTVQSGLIEISDDLEEKSITTGSDFCRLFGARMDVLLQVLERLLIENTMSAHQKKDWKSGIGSSPFSTEPRRARAGRKPAKTARRVATEGSASNGAVTAPPKSRSGSTEISRSPPARSLH